jgi:ABC-type transport system involved in multi-copper enzyme maturation permease subunit
MLLTLLLRELNDLMKSFRFAAGWLLVLVLMATAVVLLSGDVRQTSESLTETERNRNTFLTDYGHLNRSFDFVVPIRQREQTEVMFRGLDNEEEGHSFFSDPVKSLFPRLDIIYITSVLVSILAIVFTYDSVCGEREEGTLKLVHSTSVTRATVILAKWLGGWIAVSVPFLVVFMFTVSIGAFFGGLVLTAEVVTELSAIAAAAMAYIGFFLCLGLLVSSIVKHSGTSVLILLFLWVFFVLVVPNASPIAASLIKPIPSVNAVEREVELIGTHLCDKRREEELYKMLRELRREYEVPATLKELSLAKLRLLGWDAKKISRFSKEYQARFQEIDQRVRYEQDVKASALVSDMRRKIDAQSELARTISLLSPTSSLTYFTTDVAAVGLRAERHFQREARTFMQKDFLGQYLPKKEIELKKKTGRAYVRDDYLNMSDRPRFQHRPEPVASRLTAALPYLGHLVVCMLIVLLLAIAAYQRYDVR